MLFSSSRLSYALFCIHFHRLFRKSLFQLDGITVNGVDMIKWNSEGKIVDFKVMVRPVKAITILQKKMGEQLAASKV
jgi:hypothetical protein